MDWRDGKTTDNVGKGETKEKENMEKPTDYAKEVKVK